MQGGIVNRCRLRVSLSSSAATAFGILRHRLLQLFVCITLQAFADPVVVGWVGGEVWRRWAVVQRGWGCWSRTIVGQVAVLDRILLSDAAYAGLYT